MPSRFLSLCRPTKLVCSGLLAWVAIGAAYLVAVPRAEAAPTRLRFEPLGIEDGLPELSVLSVVQDRQGFLWFATQGGVARFDGYGMRVFRHHRDEPDSLSSNRVWKLFEDRQGTLWLGTAEGGLDRFRPELESFEAYRHDPADPGSLPSDRVWGFHEDRNGDLWIATSAGLARFESETGSFSNWMVGEAIRAIESVASSDPMEALWIGTSRRGLVHFDPATGQGHSFHSDPADPKSLPNDRVMVLHRDRGGSLWVGTAGGLARFDEENGRFQVFRHDPADAKSLAGEQAVSVLEDRAGNLWIGTNRGLSRFHRETGTFDNFLHDPTEQHTLPNHSVATIFEDRTGVLWVGTWYGGVAKVNPRARFTNSFRGGNPRSSLPGGVLALHEDAQGAWWVGTTGGLVHLDPHSDQYRVPGPPHAEPQDVAGIVSDPEGQVWVGYRNGELERWQSSREPSHRLSLNSNERRPNYINTLGNDPSGNLWIAHGGLVKLERDLQQTRFDPSPDDPTSLAPSGIRSLARGREGSLWVGYSDHGLARLAPGSEKFEHFRLYEETTGQPSVSSIYEGESAVWVGTNAGLFQLVPGNEEHRVRAFTVRDGLASDLVSAILPDEAGHLWLSTVVGITRFDPKTGSFRNFGTTDGTLPGGYNRGVAMRIRDGRMLFGGPNGLTSFDPSEILEDTDPPTVVLTDLRLSNRSLDPRASTHLDRPIHLTEELVLGPDDDLISFEFAALHFASPGSNRYAYQLEGFDPDWILTDASRRFATYTDLPPGRYTLRVRASNSDESWNAEGAALRVVVQPPWWRTWWAYLLYVLAFGGAIVGLVLANRRLEALVVDRTAEVRRQARQIQQESDAKARFIANVSHELRTPLTLTIGPLQQLHDDLHTAPDNPLGPTGRQNLEVALANSQRMMGLVGQVLDLGRMEAGRLELRLAEYDLVEVVRRTLARFALEARRAEITLESVLPNEPVSLVLDIDAIDKVVSNLLSNALKFTPHGSVVRVSLEQDEQEVRLCVEDQGRGISEDDLPRVFERYFQGSQTPATQPGTGIGLALVKDLVERHGGRVGVESRRGEGSRFTVILLRGHGHFPAEALDHEEVHSEEVPTKEVHSERGPRGELAVIPPIAHEAAPPEIPEEERPAVLIVEDNAELRTFLAVRLLTSYRVLQAENGAEGLQLARQQMPDLIVSDVMMPVLDGIAMLRQLREDPEISFLPVVLLTAKATKQETLEGLQGGADDYLTKPFDVAELVARIEGILAARRRLSEHLRLEQEKSPPRFETFEDRVLRTILEHLHDSSFTVRDLATALAIDRTALFRRVKQSYRKSPSELIRQIRLERAANLLRAREGNVTEVCYAVGFPSLSYFGKRFRERYGVAPSRFGRDARHEVGANREPSTSA